MVSLRRRKITLPRSAYIRLSFDRAGGLHRIPAIVDPIGSLEGVGVLLNEATCIAKIDMAVSHRVLVQIILMIALGRMEALQGHQLNTRLLRTIPYKSIQSRTRDVLIFCIGPIDAGPILRSAIVSLPI